MGQAAKQCDQIWQNFEPSVVSCYATGQIVNGLNDQILKHNLAIWSQCHQISFKSTWEALT